MAQQPYTRIETVTFFGYFNNDSFFLDFYKSMKYHPETIFDEDQKEAKVTDEYVEGILLSTPESFLRLIIDCTFNLGHDFFFQLDRLINSMDKTLDEKVSFCYKFLWLLDVVNLKGAIQGDRIGPYTKDYFRDNLDFLDKRQLLMELPNFLNKIIERNNEIYESVNSSSQVLGPAIIWEGPPSKFMELLHTLVDKKWMKFPEKSKLAIAESIFQFVQFKDVPKISSLVSYQNADQPLAENVENRYHELFHQYRGPYFLGMRKNDGLKTVAPKSNSRKNSSKKA